MTDEQIHNSLVRLTQYDLNKIAKIFGSDYYLVFIDDLLRVNRKYARDYIAFNLTNKRYTVNLIRTDTITKKIQDTLKVLEW